jgi:hypothetical protein
MSEGNEKIANDLFFEEKNQKNILSSESDSLSNKLE